MLNPISQARNFSAITTTRLARELEVSRQYISRAEQGLYENINNRLLDWTAETLNASLGTNNEDDALQRIDIMKSYEEWQWKHRESTKSDKVLRPIEINRHYNPGIIYYHRVFVDWRRLYWNTCHEFCVDMCLHTSPVAKYEEGDIFKMPRQLKEVLSKLGLLGHGFRTNER